MPNLPRVRYRTINVGPDCLPPPATKLVITQILQASQDPPFWAWIVVAAFYDQHDRIIWSTEVFAAHLDIQFESDNEGSESETDVGSVETDSTASARSPEAEYSNPPEPQLAPSFHLHQAHNAHQVYPPCFPAPSAPTYVNPPVSWDPTLYGPVPGHWQASFDPNLRRWVHTWQPLF